MLLCNTDKIQLIKHRGRSEPKRLLGCVSVYTFKKEKKKNMNHVESFKISGSGSTLCLWQFGGLQNWRQGVD